MISRRKAAIIAMFCLTPRAIANDGIIIRKNQRTLESFVLSEHGCGRATAYSEFNKIVTIGAKTHVSWLDSMDGQFLVRIRTFDRPTASWSPTCTIGQAYGFFVKNRVSCPVLTSW